MPRYPVSKALTLLTTLATTSCAFLCCALFTFPLFELRLHLSETSVLEQFINRIYVRTPIIEKTFYNLAEFYECKSLITAFWVLKFASFAAISCSLGGFVCVIAGIIFSASVNEDSDSGRTLDLGDDHAYTAVPTDDTAADHGPSVDASEHHVLTWVDATFQRISTVNITAALVTATGVALVVINVVIALMYHSSWCAKDNEPPHGCATPPSQYGGTAQRGQCDPFAGCVYSFKEMGFTRGTGFTIALSALVCSCIWPTTKALLIVWNVVSHHCYYYAAHHQTAQNSGDSVPPVLSLANDAA